MIKTPLTKFPLSRVNQHRSDVARQLIKAKRSREEAAEQIPSIWTPKALLVWSFAAGALIGSRRSTTKVIQRPTKTIKTGPSLLSLMNTVLSVMALKYKVQKAVPSQNANKSR